MLLWAVYLAAVCTSSTKQRWSLLSASRFGKAERGVCPVQHGPGADRAPVCQYGLWAITIVSFTNRSCFVEGGGFLRTGGCYVSVHAAHGYEKEPNL